MRLCAACLLGFYCRYDGETNISKSPQQLLQDYRRGRIIPVCPEQLGGCPTPREANELQKCSGGDVIDEKGSVITESGADITPAFLRGAEEVLRQAKTLKAEISIGAQKSPSCGRDWVHDGTFTKTFIRGEGVTTALLRRHGLQILLPHEYGLQYPR